MTEPDYEDPDVEERWCMERRDHVGAYLREQGVDHGEIGEWPAWHVAPITSIWAIASLRAPGSVGWWVICGDHPTDYVSAATIKHPRGALRAICDQWQSVADSMNRGEEHSDMRIGQPKDWPTLGPLLECRIVFFREVAADDSVWDYDESEFEER